MKVRETHTEAFSAPPTLQVYIRMIHVNTPHYKFTLACVGSRFIACLWCIRWSTSNEGTGSWCFLTIRAAKQAWNPPPSLSPPPPPTCHLPSLHPLNNIFIPSTWKETIRDGLLVTENMSPQHTHHASRRGKNENWKKAEKRAVALGWELVEDETPRERVKSQKINEVRKRKVCFWAVFGMCAYLVPVCMYSWVYVQLKTEFASAPMCNSCRET